MLYGNGGGTVVLAISARTIGYILGGCILIVLVTVCLYIQHKQHEEVLARLVKNQARPETDKQNRLQAPQQKGNKNI